MNKKKKPETSGKIEKIPIGKFEKVHIDKIEKIPIGKIEKIPIGPIKRIQPHVLTNTLTGEQWALDEQGRKYLERKRLRKRNLRNT